METAGGGFLRVAKGRCFADAGMAKGAGWVGWVPGCGSTRVSE